MGFYHFCNCLCAHWQEGFPIDNNHRAWHSIGVVPFTRMVYWEPVEKERARDKACAKVDLDASNLNVQDMVQTTFGTDNREEVVDPRIQTTPLTSSMFWDKGPITSDVCLLWCARLRRSERQRRMRKQGSGNPERTSWHQRNKFLASLPPCSPQD